LATVTANGSGAWSAIMPALSNGPHVLLIIAQDVAGNISPAASTTITVNVPAGGSSSSSGGGGGGGGGCGLGSGLGAFLLALMFGLRLVLFRGSREQARA
jgi:hypothetical protein